jgi:hypothetical protein
MLCFRSFVILALLVDVQGCQPPAPLASVAATQTSIRVPTSRVRVEGAVGIDPSAVALPALTTGQTRLSLLAQGNATRLPRPNGANAVFLALATPELSAPNADVQVALDGALANDPADPAGALGDATKEAGPSCVLPETPTVPNALLEGHAAFGLLDVPTPIPDARDSERFWVIRPGLAPMPGQPYNEVEIQAKRTYVGVHCQIYLDESVVGDGNTADAARALAEAFDATIYPTDTRIFGLPPEPGIDGDARIFILVSPQVSASGKTGVLAYFARRDLARRDDGLSTHGHSNQKELLCVDARTLAPGRRTDLLAAVAHEFQHLINYHQKAVVAGVAGGEERWLDEALAMYASGACGYGITVSPNMYQHVAGYLQSAYQFSLTDWAGNPAGQGYGMGYLFTSYLAERFGEGIISELLHANERGKANLDARLRAHGSSYTAAFGDFAVALAVAGLLPDTDAGRFKLSSVPLRGVTPFGTLDGPSAIRIGVSGARLPRHADTAYLLHLRPGAGDLVLRTAGGPFFGAAITP